MCTESEKMRSELQQRTAFLKKIYNMEAHVEGGSFSEVYTAPFEKNGRSLAGSIFFLLDVGEISHFHEIDCDEIWYYHEGCGIRITMLADNGIERYLLGCNPHNEERAMVVIPKGRIFAAENLKPDGYTLVSCVTVPKFEYSGFRLLGRNEIRQRYGDAADEIDYLAYER